MLLLVVGAVGPVYKVRKRAYFQVTGLGNGKQLLAWTVSRSGGVVRKGGCFIVSKGQLDSVSIFKVKCTAGRKERLCGVHAPYHEKRPSWRNTQGAHLFIFSLMRETGTIFRASVTSAIDSEVDVMSEESADNHSSEESVHEGDQAAT
jgi:hypothetical protein